MHLQTNTEAWEARKKKEYLDCRHEVTKILGVGRVWLPEFLQTQKLQEPDGSMFDKYFDFPQPATVI